MHNPNVLTGQESPVSVPNPVTGGMTGNFGGVPQPDTAVDVFNSTLLPMLFTLLLQQKYYPDTKYSFRDEYDYIVVGAGAAGCVVASRLSEKECVTVLHLEAGKIAPALSEPPFAARMMLITNTNWNFVTEPQEHTCGEQSEHRMPYHAGKGVGGTTLVSTMAYSRGNRQDYEDWVAMGAEGWDYNNVLPYFLKLENNTDMDIASDGSCHNVSGPMTFGRPQYNSRTGNALLEGLKSLGYPVVDVNCEQQLGVADFQAALRRGQRCSAAKAYLVPADNRPNLDIIAEAFVRKIEIVNKTAQAVCFDYKGSVHCVRARKEIIVSAGAIKTPQILMLSGIGPKETLEKFKIPVHVDLPAVGANLQDHPTTVMFLEASQDIQYEVKLLSPGSLAEYQANRTGPIASPGGILVLQFDRTNDAATPEGVPNFESCFAEMSPHAIKTLYRLNPSTYVKLFYRYELSSFVGCFSSVMNPKSRGFVTINSDDPHDDPVIDPKFLADPQDMKDILAGLKLCSDVAETAQVKTAGIKPFETKMPGCEDFANDKDKYRECYVRKFAFSSGHYSSTAKMGSELDTTAVVDPTFRVKGIYNLRVIDASTMPKLVSGDPMIPTMMMAEKGSDIIKETIHC